MNIADVSGPIIGNLEGAIQRQLFLNARKLQKATSKEILRKPKGGRTYTRITRSGQRRRHVASAPGETHANMSGDLRKALGFKIHPMKIEFGYGVQGLPAPVYAAKQEFGPEPRPSLQNGVQDQRNIIISDLEEAIVDAII